jgi:hypothetical protein
MSVDPKSTYAYVDQLEAACKRWRERAESAEDKAKDGPWKSEWFELEGKLAEAHGLFTETAAVIDALFDFLAESGLAEGGLPLYEAMKPVAEARATIAAFLSSEVAVEGERTPKPSTQCERGHHVLCEGNAGLRRRCSCDCHPATLADSDPPEEPCVCGSSRVEALERRLQAEKMKSAEVEDELRSTLGKGCSER